jgi:hypothetical protein
MTSSDSQDLAVCACPLDGIPVQVDAETRFFGNVNPAVVVDRICVFHGKPECLLGQEQLEVLAVADGAGDVEAGDVYRPHRGRVDFALRTVGLGQVSDLERAGDAR